MTKSQALAHEDQLAALRERFMQRWEKEILPLLSDLSERSRCERMQQEWNFFSTRTCEGCGGGVPKGYSSYCPDCIAQMMLP